jgi:hypothetical protein
MDLEYRASRGRLRRLALLLVPMVVASGVPWLLVSRYEDRLPDRAYVEGWSRVGPRYADLAPTWSSWSAGWLYCLLFALVLAAMFWRLRQWPQLQRMLVAVSWVFGGIAVAEAASGVFSLLDVNGYPQQPAAWWYGGLGALVGLLGGGVGWVLAGAAPPLREAADPPAPDLPVRSLGPTERAMFSETVWSAKARAVGVALLVCGPAVLLLDLYWSGMAVILLVQGLGMVLQAKARIQVDGVGLLLTLPLLGRAGRRVAYRHVRHAEIVEGFPAGGWGLADNKRHWGYVTGRGPAVVLRLTDDRPFIASLRDPATAAALINGQLARERTAGTTAGSDR